MRLTLVVMAAGMGSRYGGLKQIDRIGPNGEIILELSVYDAIKAGFERVVFILRKDIEDEFKELIGNKISRFVEVEYVIQDLNNVPEGFSVPLGREKPWGTGHAILSAKDILKDPFVVINADDYYGREGFKLMYDFLMENESERIHAMVGFNLCNTLSENGHVARGICEVEGGYLKDVVERTKIIKSNDRALFTEDDSSWSELDYNSVVSMNMWGFMPSILNHMEDMFTEFFKREVKENPLKCEYFIPKIVGDLLSENKIMVSVMESKDKWYGVTYQEDKDLVKGAIGQMIHNGIYPKSIWEVIE